MKKSGKIIIICGFALGIGLVVFGLIQSFFPDKTKYDFVAVERQTVIQEVSITGF